MNPAATAFARPSPPVGTLLQKAQPARASASAQTLHTGWVAADESDLMYHIMAPLHTLAHRVTPGPLLTTKQSGASAAAEIEKQYNSSRAPACTLAQGDPKAFADYQAEYRNTICGRHPIGVLLNVSGLYCLACPSVPPCSAVLPCLLPAGTCQHPLHQPTCADAAARRNQVQDRLQLLRPVFAVWDDSGLKRQLRSSHRRAGVR